MRTAELLAEHGTIERQPLLEGRSMYIVMAPLEKRAEKKTDERRRATSVRSAAGDTIGDAIAAKGQAPQAAERGAGTAGIVHNAMPKMKTHKGTAKRYRKTGSGKWIRPKAWRGHHLEIKSSRRTRRYAGMAEPSRDAHRRARAADAVRRQGEVADGHASSAASPPTVATSGCSTAPRVVAARARSSSARRARR